MNAATIVNLAAIMAVISCSSQIMAEEIDMDAYRRAKEMSLDQAIGSMPKKLEPWEKGFTDEEVKILISEEFAWGKLAIMANTGRLTRFTALTTIHPRYFEGVLEETRKVFPDFDRNLILRLPRETTTIEKAELRFFPPQSHGKNWSPWHKSAMDMMDVSVLKKREDLDYSFDPKSPLWVPHRSNVLVITEGFSFVFRMELWQTAEYGMYAFLRAASLTLKPHTHYHYACFIPALPDIRNNNASPVLKTTGGYWAGEAATDVAVYGHGNISFGGGKFSVFGKEELHELTPEKLSAEDSESSFESRVESKAGRLPDAVLNPIIEDGGPRSILQRDLIRTFLSIPEQQETAGDGVFAATLLQATDDRIRLSWASDEAHKDWMVRVQIDQGELYIPDLKGNELIILQDKDKKAENVTATFYLIKPDFSMALTHKVRFDYRLNK